MYWKLPGLPPTIAPRDSMVPIRTYGAKEDKWPGPLEPQVSRLLDEGEDQVPQLEHQGMGLVFFGSLAFLALAGAVLQVAVLMTSSISCLSFSASRLHTPRALVV